MKKIRTDAMLAFIAIGLASFTAACSGQESNHAPVQPHFTGQAPGERQVIFQKITGSIGDVDTNTMTLKIGSGKETRRFKITSKTKFTHDDGQPASFGDIKAGKTATVIIARVYGQPDEVVTVNLQAN